MASWDNYPPPPRRSRSRSPIPPFSTRDPYNMDGRYPRERSYGYGRESPTDMRRARSRSPVPGDGSKKRRRSPSPWEAERYDPRPRYSENYERPPAWRGGYSPVRRNQYNRRPPPDPHSFDFPGSLKQYADWFRYTFPQRATQEDNMDKAAEQEAGDGSKPRNGLRLFGKSIGRISTQLKYLQTMFDYHRKSPWFAEKYDPSPAMQKLRSRVRKEGWKGRLVTFLHDLDSGKFDPDLNEPEQEPTGAKEEPSANGEPKESNGEAEPKNSGDDDMQFTMDADEPTDNEASRADANGKDSKRGNREPDLDEEVTAPTEGNQVMIRTIPPDIGRVKLEEACSKIPGYVYLALGDPMSKRNYYRAGWLRFDENADMGAVMSELSDTKIEGFKLHVSHNTRPFTSRVRCAPEVASKPDRLEKDLANAIALASLYEEQAAQLRQMKIHEHPKLPVYYSVEEGPQTAAIDLPELPAEEEEEDPTEKGADAIERRVEKIMADMRDQGILDMNDEAAVAAKKTVITLDLYLEYLRAAFNTCYYCAVTTDHVEELQRKCLKHVRKPLSKALLEEVKAAEVEKAERENKMDDSVDLNGDKDEKKDKDTKKDSHALDRDWKRNDERWLDWMDSKMALLMNRDGVDPAHYGGRKTEEELTRLIDPHIKMEDEGKFRCRTCQKLFKATSFIEKHVANKHPELIKTQLEEMPYFNNFALDPHRLQPALHPPPPSGNSSQAPPPQAYGVQLKATYHQHQQQTNDPARPYGHQSALPASMPQTWSSWTGVGGLQIDLSTGMFVPGPVITGAYPITRGRRLSDRIAGDYMPFEVPAGAGLPPKPMSSMSALDAPLSSGNNRRGGRSGVASGSGLPPPPPPDAKEDPRAAAGKRVSYHDMDLVAEGDVELSY
ncbi:hypothetical protein BDZ89DRAFT_1103455 [Hymenopellis radicata]|nr:hypothetical protein BDZ89DRAFT_1103455 [Hymenopellis radicata]